MYKDIGTRVKQLRKETGITQEQLAEYLGIDQTTVTKLENGTRNLNVTMIERICDLFGCTDEYLMGESETYMPVSFAFRATGIEADDLKSIAAVNRIMMDIRFINELMGDE
ncbi:MAG: helix-turn-helix transcriptional regulator [Erysipelotrichaceae bacterium]|nr:helix-turn-helix transcriptional regulator [Erysipelotrichaceae bacterium]